MYNDIIVEKEFDNILDNVNKIKIGYISAINKSRNV